MEVKLGLARVPLRRHDVASEPHADAELVVFEESSHVPHIEEPGLFRGAVREFLRQVDAGSLVPKTAGPVRR